MKRGTIVLASLLFVGVLFVGIGTAQVVRMGDLGITSDAPFYIAMEKGYFKERGIEVKLEKFASAAAAMAPLSSGELHVVGGGINPALFNAFARGFPVKVVAARSRDIPGNTSDSLMIRADLKGQIRKYADLKGRKIAINAPGSALVYMLGRMLESEGLSLKDVEVVYIPWPDMAPAFTRKAIDAGTLVDPFVVEYEDKGYAYLWKRASDLIKDPWWEVAVIFYNKDWADKNPQAAKDFMTAYIKAARMMHAAITLKEPKARAEYIDVLVKYTRVKDKALHERMTTGYIDPNGVVSKESLREQQDWYAKQGTVPKKVDIDEIVDEQYVKYAVQQLGVYAPRRP